MKEKIKLSHVNHAVFMLLKTKFCDILKSEKGYPDTLIGKIRGHFKQRLEILSGYDIFHVWRFPRFTRSVF